MILVHVDQVRSTNNVVESSKSPVITGFFHAPNTSEYALDTFLDTFSQVFLKVKNYDIIDMGVDNMEKLYFEIPSIERKNEAIEYIN